MSEKCHTCGREYGHREDCAKRELAQHVAALREKLLLLRTTLEQVDPQKRRYGAIHLQVEGLLIDTGEK